MTRIGVTLFCLSLAGVPLLSGRQHPDPRILHLGDFAKKPWLRAHTGQTVFLDGESDDPAETAIPYELEAGKHEFCLQGGDAYFAGLVLRDHAGNIIFTMPGHQRCFTVTVGKGIYTLHIRHSSEGFPNPKRFGRVQLDFPSAPLVDANGNPAGGYWAIVPNSLLYKGRLTAQQPPRILGDPPSFYTNAMPLVADGSSVFDEYSLFSFPPGKNHPLLLAPGFFVDQLTNTTSASEAGTVIAGDYTCPADTEPPEFPYHLCDVFSGFDFSSIVKDLGHYQFSFTGFSLQPTPFSNLTLLENSDSNAPSTTMSVLFRFYPDGTQIGNLNEGEAALYEGCNYQGKGVVISDDGLDPLSYTSDATTLTNSLVSVRIGNNTAVQLILAVGTGTSVVTLYNDAACLSDPVDEANWVLRLDENLAAGASVEPNEPCPNCRLVGADLSAFTLANADWQGADMSGATISGTQFTNGTNLTGAKFIGATVNDASFQGATLTGTDFTGAKLTCVNFSGTDSQHLADLTQPILTNVQWIPSTSCLSNLAYTKLTVASVPPAYWKYADLTGAVFVDLKPGIQLSSQANAVDMSGARLADVSLPQVVLDYANLTGADLTQTLLSKSSLQHANLGTAKLYGAKLINANLESANLQSAYLTNNPPTVQQAADLTGAFLRNANLSFAQLSGANFTDASFYGFNGAYGPGVDSCAVNDNGETNGCATAHHAIMNNTVFSGAYLFGVDFTTTQATGANFSNAVLTGANFDSAALGSDSAAASTTSFESAFLQGANLGGATLDHVSLAGAFVDFNPQGNTLDLQLPGTHTQFPGYWSTPGQDVCAEPGYSLPTSVPTTNSTITCPDGNQYLDGCGAADPQGTNLRWKSGTNISSANTPASYEQNATYTSASTNPICTDDPIWDVGGNNYRTRRKDR
ncbi:MAG: pentapeptide repeat-containing protein [Acidobacteriaceae bacterium]|nr:pentapeptide repeat-containing protein [Acidobacteriaceae bacterium]MBV8572779.1 pentapeptide repeat-containing protein [Acidobacteriaceae bacterium]